jgi:hypothetical protein
MQYFGLRKRRLCPVNYDESPCSPSQRCSCLQALNRGRQFRSFFTSQKRRLPGGDSLRSSHQIRRVAAPVGDFDLAKNLRYDDNQRIQAYRLHASCSFSLSSGIRVIVSLELQKLTSQNKNSSSVSLARITFCGKLRHFLLPRRILPVQMAPREKKGQLKRGRVCYRSLCAL